MVLSWLGLQHLHQVLVAQPLNQAELTVRLAEEASIKPETANRYIYGARALGLLTFTTDHLTVLPTRTPEELLFHSSLIRIFLCWQQLGTPPLNLHNHLDAFRLLGEGRLSLLQTARQLARRAQLPVLPRPGASLILSAGQLRMERLGCAERPWDALEALAFYRVMLPADACESEPVNLFVRDCQYLHHRRLLRMDVVQYLAGTNRRYASLSTPLGFLRGLWLNEGERQDESFSTIGQDTTPLRRVAG